MSDKVIIEDIERQIAEERELEGYVPAKAKVSRRLSVSFAIRMSPDEYKAFNQAAKARGMTLADFMRSATRGAITGEIDAGKAAALNSGREKAEELSEVLRHL
jgi:uncharacterized protein (DUF1778 family)